MKRALRAIPRTVPAVSWSAEEVQSRVALLDQMLAVTSNPAGQLALPNARTLVLSKTGQREGPVQK